MQERNQKMMSRMAASMDEDGDGVVDEEEMAASLGPLGHCLAMIPPRLVSVRACDDSHVFYVGA